MITAPVWANGRPRRGRIRDEREVLEKFFAARGGEQSQNFQLQGAGEFARDLIAPPALGPQADAVGAAVLLVFRAFQQAGLFHAVHQRGDGVRVAGHQLGEFALRGAFVFEQRAHHGELVGRDAEVGDAPAEGLVESVPRAAQQRRQAAAVRGIDRQRGGGAGRFARGHGQAIRDGDTAGWWRGEVCLNAVARSYV